MVGASIGTVAIVSSYYLFQSISHDVWFSSPAPESPIESEDPPPKKEDETKWKLVDNAETLSGTQVCTSSSEVQEELPKLTKNKEMYEKDLITASEMDEYRQNSVRRLENHLLEHRSSFDFFCLKKWFEANNMLYDGRYITASNYDNIRRIIYERLSNICENKTIRDDHLSCLELYKEFYSDNLITASQLDKSRSNTFQSLLMIEIASSAGLEESVAIFRNLYDQNLITASQMESARTGLLDASGELIELQ